MPPSKGSEEIPMVKCWFCQKSFKTKKALYAHLQFCSERKKQKDQWIRYAVSGPRFEGCIGVISRSPKTLELVNKAHKKLESGAISPEGFAGYIMALSDVGLVEYMTEAARSAREPQPAEEVIA